MYKIFFRLARQLIHTRKNSVIATFVFPSLSIFTLWPPKLPTLGNQLPVGNVLLVGCLEDAVLGGHLAAGIRGQPEVEMLEACSCLVSLPPGQQAIAQFRGSS